MMNKTNKTFSGNYWINLLIVLFVVISVTLVCNKDPEEKRAEKAEEEWKEFTSMTDNFKVSFPKYPEHESRNVPLPNNNVMKIDSYFAEDIGGTDYSIAVYRYFPPIPKDVFNPEERLQRGINKTASAPGNKLISSSFTTFNGYKAVDYLIEHHGKYDLELRGRVILVEQTPYKLTAIYEIQNKPDNYEKFINSFQLLKREQN